MKKAVHQGVAAFLLTPSLMEHTYHFNVYYKDTNACRDIVIVFASCIKIAKLETYAKFKTRVKHEYPGDEEFMDRYTILLSYVIHQGPVKNKERKEEVRGLVGPFGIEL
jgi:hypothetical protein